MLCGSKGCSVPSAAGRVDLEAHHTMVRLLICVVASLAARGKDLDSDPPWRRWMVKVNATACAVCGVQDHQISSLSYSRETYLSA